MKRVCVIGAVLGVVVGCATAPPPSYYTLDMRPSGKAECPVKLDIQRLREAEPLARKDILIQKTPTEVEYYASDQWAAALGEMVAQKLTAEFGPGASDGETLLVSGRILSFEQVDVNGGAQALARIVLEFRERDASLYEEPLLKKTYEASVPAESATPGKIVLALSRALEEIAAAASTDVQALK